MGGKQSKVAVIIKGTETLSIQPTMLPHIQKSFVDVDPGRQLHQLLTTSLDNYDVKDYCNKNQLWAKVMKICDTNPTAAAYTEPVRFETPLHLACRIIEQSPPLGNTKEMTASPADAIRVLIRCSPESLSKTDIDGYIPLHYILPHSRKSTVSHHQQTHQTHQTQQTQQTQHKDPQSLL